MKAVERAPPDRSRVRQWWFEERERPSGAMANRVGAMVIVLWAERVAESSARALAVGGRRLQNGGGRWLRRGPSAGPDLRRAPARGDEAGPLTLSHGGHVLDLHHWNLHH